MTGTLDAARYDAWFDAPWGRYASQVERQALLDALGPLDGRELVDIGCGTGRFTASRVNGPSSGSRVGVADWWSPP
ncbi:MAG TPA: hypothetical protein VK906_06265 [Egicoccus sp.]|nr:hypothetical protein [Egicoccus sp.]HSK22758.1 hypothetical protein [Egicoccus sp.]